MLRLPYFGANGHNLTLSPLFLQGIGQTVAELRADDRLSANVLLDPDFRHVDTRPPAAGASPAQATIPRPSY